MNVDFDQNLKHDINQKQFKSKKFIHKLYLNKMIFFSKNVNGDLY